jgi:hypothetical protein
MDKTFFNSVICSHLLELICLQPNVECHPAGIKKWYAQQKYKLMNTSVD